jgi:hypothetical protein
LRYAFDGRVKRTALGALALVAAVAAIVTFPRWGDSDSGSLAPAVTIADIDPVPSSEPPNLSLSPDDLNTQLPAAPPIDTKRVLNDPCAAITTGLLAAVDVQAEPERDGKWRCEAEAGKRTVEVDVREPESNNPADTSREYSVAHDERPEPIATPWYVYKLWKGDVTMVTLFCADVVVSLSLPVEDVDEEVVRDLIDDLR